jgi:hypothetical protein
MAESLTASQFSGRVEETTILFRLRHTVFQGFPVGGSLSVCPARRWTPLSFAKTKSVVKDILVGALLFCSALGKKTVFCEFEKTEMIDLPPRRNLPSDHGRVSIRLGV